MGSRNGVQEWAPEMRSRNEVHDEELIRILWNSIISYIKGGDLSLSGRILRILGILQNSAGFQESHERVTYQARSGLICHPPMEFLQSGEILQNSKNSQNPAGE